MSPSSVALVHDYLLVMRGAERTFAAMAECWPEAPIYTLLYDEEGTGGQFADRVVNTSYLQRLGIRQRGFRALLPAFPRAVRGLRLDGHDLVVSSSSAFAHAVARPRGAHHVCYCHTPFRYAWFQRERALEEVAAPLRPALRRTLWKIREGDRAAARAVTGYVANSAVTQRRIASYWGRESSVVHPPVEVERFQPAAEVEDYFLVVTELVPHKRVELALEAAERAGARLRVVGEGPERERLEARYGGAAGSAEFLGRVDDAELARLYARARAMVLPNEEEFGIAAVEAQAAGRPVVAAAAGGALETVLDGETGILIEPGDIDGFARALAATDFSRFDAGRIAARARHFSKAAFQRRLRDQVEELSTRS
ncbi:MAG TPA: glycosyltransferase [Solirubrobacterales bacterium]|nr:glycosyltransferase [Solirubrobacterales bacterium]